MNLPLQQGFFVFWFFLKIRWSFTELKHSSHFIACSAICWTIRFITEFSNEESFEGYFIFFLFITLICCVIWRKIALLGGHHRWLAHSPHYEIILFSPFLEHDRTVSLPQITRSSVLLPTMTSLQHGDFGWIGKKFHKSAVFFYVSKKMLIKWKHCIKGFQGWTTN